VLAALGRAAVDGKRVGVGVDGAPFGELGLEGRLDLLVLDQVLDEVRETVGLMALLLGYTVLVSCGVGIVRVVDGVLLSANHLRVLE
jgi:hypothetical protein